jgi:hypothetical protein
MAAIAVPIREILILTLAMAPRRLSDEPIDSVRCPLV